MLNLIFFVLSITITGVEAFIHTDYNCTNFNGTKFFYTVKAFNCQNLLSDAACETLHPRRNTDEDPSKFRVDMDPFRPHNCFATQPAQNTFIPELKAVAIAQCPKRCGYCCQTADFSCSNALYPRLNCNTITSAQCLSPEWRTIIASDCPAACGFCTFGGCVDAIPSCANDITICNAVGLQNFVNTNCQRTCQRCPSTTLQTASAPRCTSFARDVSPNCATWKVNGFCTNNFYAPALRKLYCATSCQIC